MVDDSIVRGNTQRALVRMLREAGALEVHVRIASPPVRWPCFYGIDFATRAELVAGALDTEGVRRSIGADSLGYVSLEGLIAASEQPPYPAVHGLLRRGLPDPAARGGAARQAPAGADRAGRRTATSAGAADTVSGAASGRSRARCAPSRPRTGRRRC